MNLACPTCHGSGSVRVRACLHAPFGDSTCDCGKFDRVECPDCCRGCGFDHDAISELALDDFKHVTKWDEGKNRLQFGIPTGDLFLGNCPGTCGSTLAVKLDGKEAA